MIDNIGTVISYVFPWRQCQTVHYAYRYCSLQRGETNDMPDYERRRRGRMSARLSNRLGNVAISLLKPCHRPTLTWLSRGPTKLARTRPSRVYVPVPGLTDNEELKTGWPGRYTSDMLELVAYISTHTSLNRAAYTTHSVHRHQTSRSQSGIV